jgi:hypothetical protein
MISLLLETQLSPNDVRDDVRLVLVVYELRGNHVLEELVGDLRARDHSSDRKTVLRMVKNITHQEGFSSVFLTYNYDHGRFPRVHGAPLLDDVHVKFSYDKVHIT